MKTKLDAFAKALQKRNPDDSLVDFFNEMYAEQTQNENYIAELELTQLGHEIKQRNTLELLASAKRLRVNAEKSLVLLQSLRK
ncbi:MAG: hypothetical protein OEY89_01425 [Gammaproteobacteria bacterium]|nr:hypothetical protein [Gammaproteobacteria bacterium]